MFKSFLPTQNHPWVMTQVTSSLKENDILATTSVEKISLPSGEEIEIPECKLIFKKWSGIPIKETFGGKALIDVNGQPMFAELALMHLFIKSGWKSRWVETYATGDKMPKILSEWKDVTYKDQVQDPIVEKRITDLLEKISVANGGSYAGCWDVLGWNADEVIFVESKRHKRDRIQETQLNWLSAALRVGLTPNNFRIVQWEFE